MVAVVTGIVGGGVVYANPELTVTFEDDTSVFVRYVDKDKFVDSLEKLNNQELASGLSLTIKNRNVVKISCEGHEVHLNRNELLDKLYSS